MPTNSLEALNLVLVLVILLPVAFLIFYWIKHGWRLVRQEWARLRLRNVSLGDIDRLDGFEFEAWVTEAMRAQGYRTVDLPNVGDRGGDVMSYIDGDRFIIQAKRYGSAVNNKPVQELMQAFAHYNARQGAVVTNNVFTDAAREAAEDFEEAFDVRIELWDRETLKGWVKQGYGSTEEFHH